MLNGYKTYIIALSMGLLPLITEQLSGVNWVLLLSNLGVPEQYVVPLAGVLAAMIMAGMRKLTEVTTVNQALLTEPPKNKE